MKKWQRKHKNTWKNKSCRTPGWCGSVDWTLDHEAEDCWFYFRLGHMLGLLAKSPVVGGREATTHWCFSPSLFSLLSPNLKINKTTNLLKNLVGKDKYIDKYRTCNIVTLVYKYFNCSIQTKYKHIKYTLKYVSEYTI